MWRILRKLKIDLLSTRCAKLWRIGGTRVRRRGRNDVNTVVMHEFLKKHFN